MAIVNRIPPGTFKGENIMTPNVIEYHQTTIDHKTVYVEVSHGRGITGKIYGVTFRHAGGGRLDPDPSQLVHSYEEALLIIGNAGDA